MQTNRRPLLLALAAALLAALSVAAAARQLDLSTAPQREGVELTIYNSEDLTLVRETRTLSFKPGINRLQFSWASTLIDPTSVELRFPRQAASLRLLDTSFPHDRPQTLYWNVDSEVAGEVLVEISYFTSGLTWSADYVVVASAEERQARIESFVRVTNNSGEDYPDARVRLVVGTINLVEKIAELARLPVAQVEKMEDAQVNNLRRQVARRAMAAGGVMSMMAPAPVDQEKAIIKEGLSEYFIYTVEGTETIPSGWSKRMRSFDADAVPLEVLYRYREREYGDQLVRLYRLINDEAAGLGSTPLPDGTVRVLRDNGAGGLSFLGVQQVQYVPVGDRLEVNLGADPRVGFELDWLESWRDEIWLQVDRGRVLRRAGEQGVRIEHDARVVGWDAHRLYVQRIHNHTGRPIRVEVRRRLDGDVTFVADIGARLHDVHTVEFDASVAAGQRLALPYEVHVRRGRNQEQNRVVLRQQPVSAEPQRQQRG